MFQIETSADRPSRDDAGGFSIITLARARAVSVLAGFMLLTLSLMPVQAALLKAWPAAARRLPCWYHRRVCALLGIRLHIHGRVSTDRPVLLVANHTSWLDIPVLSAVAPLSFVAKTEVGSWPFVASLARLQRTVFVDRRRRAAVGETTGVMADRLGAGDTLVLFAEGTSSDGNRVLPFLTALFAAAKPPGGEAARKAAPAGAPDRGASVQTLAIVYSHLHGLPLGRAQRPLVGWYGDMEMGGHGWRLLQAGPLDVHIRIGQPRALAGFPDRKALARESEQDVRRSLVRMLRARADDEPLEVAAQQNGRRSARPGNSSPVNRKWT